MKIIEMGIIIILALLMMISFFFKRWSIALLTKLGFTYYQERQKELLEIYSDIVELKGFLKADHEAFYRVYSNVEYVGKNYFPNKIKSKLLHQKPEDTFDMSLENEMYYEIVDIALQNDRTTFSYSQLKAINPQSKILVVMEKHKINYLLIHRITNYRGKEYGLLFYAWDNDPQYEKIYDEGISRKFDSINNRFYPLVESSIGERIGFRVII